MKVWKVHIKAYYFGNHCYDLVDLFVAADIEKNMLKTVNKHLIIYNKDEEYEDAEIVSYEQIDLNNTKNRVL